MRLKPGTPAPSFATTDVFGRVIALEGRHKLKYR